jgi:ribonuclease HI
VKGYTNARFKGFSCKADAQAFLSESNSMSAVRKRPGVVEKAEDVRNSAVAEKKSDEPDAKRPKRLPSPQPPTPFFETSSSTSTISVHISFDGGSRGNPGVAGAGAEVITRYLSTTAPKVEQSNQKVLAARRVIQRRKKVHHRHYLNAHSTNNQAEYQGAICGLQQTFNDLVEYARGQNLAREAFPVDLILQGDSKLVINQLKGVYQCRNSNLIPCYRQCMNLVAEMKKVATVTITFEHVYRKQNAVADGMSYTSWCNERIILVEIFLCAAYSTCTHLTFFFLTIFRIFMATLLFESLTALANEAMDAKRTWFTIFDDDENDEDAQEETRSSTKDHGSRIQWV